MAQFLTREAEIAAQNGNSVPLGSAGDRAPTSRAKAPQEMA